MDSESRSVLGPAGNKTTPIVTRFQASKPQRKVDNTRLSDDSKRKNAPNAAVADAPKPSSVMKQQDQKFRRSKFSPNASCSSDASSDSSFCGKRTMLMPTRRMISSINAEKADKQNAPHDADSISGVSADASPVQKRCSWVTPNTDTCYSAFHDEEWGVPVHDDKLFELLSLSTALSELTWPSILNRRHTLRDIFLEFDPIVVSRLSEKKMLLQGSPVIVLLSELKVRSILENARQFCKIIDEFGSFDKYIWGFVNQKPIVGHFRYPRQVPVKTSKADTISKDLIKRGFRGVGQTTIYSFMQAVGLTNDHLISCFRFHECSVTQTTSAAPDEHGHEPTIHNANKVEEKQQHCKDSIDLMEHGMTKAMDNLRLPDL
ncbi:probable GMP synthase [glutamine-hydrolyzing] isoform X2 [Impatiens glandulifera]|uniref:probable GMP synthase [glutamine-hydrolyzing] isoform X2 n=1 Tax=Impatiens glandulifera TaxID=253017 RepID=UPI001FB0E46B|nr:probable GMP synthase [glutamine-hydrolyzing] isoform X2 [Impatiens glandulifera]